MSIKLHFPVRGIQREAYGEHDRHCDKDGPPDEVLHMDERGKKIQKPFTYNIIMTFSFSNFIRLHEMSTCGLETRDSHNLFGPS